MSKARLPVLWIACGLAVAPASVIGENGPPAPPSRPAHTYSIVAFDKATGQLGVAVQSHYFSVGSAVPWAEAGVGAVATQSFVDPSYGPLGLDLMRAGKTAPEALAGLIAADKNEAVRQVAMVDARGNAAAHTGKTCIPEAGHVVGDGFTCEANLMRNGTVWGAMAKAYQETRGELVDRLVAALEAAEREGGDIRGKQSAAVIVVAAKSTGAPWRDRLYDLRVEDNPDPVPELKRLVALRKAYAHVDRGDELTAEGKLDAALEEYTTAMKMEPGNAELIFWPAVTLANTGRVEQSLPLFRKVFAMDPSWAVLVPRLPKAKQLPDDPKLIQRILAEQH